MSVGRKERIAAIVGRADDVGASLDTLSKVKHPSAGVTKLHGVFKIFDSLYLFRDIKQYLVW